MADEKPQVEEPEVPETPEEDVQAELNGVMEELKKIGVETPEQVSNLHSASQQAGKAWNRVGDLEREIEALKRKPVKQDDYDYDQQPIDLRGEIRSELRGFWKEQQEAQQASYQQMMKERSQIRSDQDYNLVGAKFEEYMANPEIQIALNSGQTTASNEYNKFVRGYYRKIALRSRDAFEKLQTTQKPKPPHVEKGSASQPTIREPDEKDEKLKQVKKKWTGGDDDIDRMLDALIEPGGLAGMGA